MTSPNDEDELIRKIRERDDEHGRLCLEWTKPGIMAASDRKALLAELDRRAEEITFLRGEVKEWRDQTSYWRCLAERLQFSLDAGADAAALSQRDEERALKVEARAALMVLGWMPDDGDPVEWARARGRVDDDVAR